MEGRCPICRWQLLVPALLAVSLAGTVGGCALVQNDVTGRSSSALRAAGVAGVQVDGDYRDVSLSGPAASRDAALAAVTSLRGVRSVHYSVRESAVAQDPRITVTGRGGRFTLRGAVTAEQHAQLLTAAGHAVSAPTDLVDRITVTPGAATDTQNAAVEVVATLLGGLPTALTSGTVTLTGRTLTVSGQLRGADIGDMQSVLDRAKGAGLTVVTHFTASPGAAAQPKVVQQRLVQLLSGTTIQFDTGSATIQPGSRSILDRAAAIMVPAMAGNAGLAVVVEGHTDNVGDAARNLALSHRRADAVVQYLIGRKVPAARLSARGYGSTRPVASNATAAGRYRNRRIAFRVVGG